MAEIEFNHLMSVAFNRGTLDKNISGTAYFAYLNENTIFHFAIWLHLNPHVKKYLTLTRDSYYGNGNGNDARECVVLFQNKEDHDAFITWREKITPWFGSHYDEAMDKNYYPRLPQSKQISIIVMKGRGGEGYNNHRVLERWLWVVANCQSPVYVLDGNKCDLAFTNQDEAVLYKTKFPCL